MDLRIEKLNEKYWAGETSLAEEKELKAYFKENPSLSKNGQYFAEVKKQQQVKPVHSFSHPGRRKIQTWMSMAAAILILITIGFFVFQNENKQDQFAVQDPQEAFEITKASLMKISEGLNKGKIYSQELNKINEAKEIINK
jgi:hypothetical protein